MLELYFDHPTVVGNANLKPETSESYEIAYLGKYGALFFQTILYFSKYENLIQRIRPDLTQPAIYRNLGEFDGYGGEIELKYINRDLFNGFLNYNYIAGENTDEAYSNYRFVPKHTISFGISKDIENFTISSNGMFYSKTYGLLGEIPAQIIINFHGSYHHHVKNLLGVTHTISITNLNGSDMLIPEYIRRRENINSLPTTGFGRRVIYSLSLDL
jgi:outer membrane receptor protein involved in Fe transport